MEVYLGPHLSSISDLIHVRNRNFMDRLMRMTVMQYYWECSLLIVLNVTLRYDFMFLCGYVVYF